MFIAQAYGVDMPISKQLAMAAVLMLTSKGVAGVPRASLVVILATLKQFGIPGGRAAADPRHRPVPRHGPQRDQCDRQFAGRGRGGEIRKESRSREGRYQQRPGRGAATGQRLNAPARARSGSFFRSAELRTAHRFRRRARRSSEWRLPRLGRRPEDTNRRRPHGAAAGERGEQAGCPRRHTQKGERYGA